MILRINKRKLCSLIFFFCSVNLVFGQVKFSNNFLEIGVGARAHGMGKAVVASVNNADAGFWNPSGLAGMERPFQVQFMHAEWMAGIVKYDYVSFAKQLGKEKKSAFGLSVIRLGTDDIPNTLNLVGADGSIDYSEVTGFSAADYGVLLSFARKIKNTGFQVGGSPKIIYRTAGRFATAWGFGLDLGMQYRKGQWSFALVGKDITSTFNAWKFNFTEEDQAVFQLTDNEVRESSVEITRPRFILGSSFNTRKQADKKIGLLLEMDLDFTTDGQRNVLLSTSSVNMDLNFGVELDYKKFVFLRAGVYNFQKVKGNDVGEGSRLTLQPNMGIGFKIGSFNIDYAYTSPGNVSDVLYSHIFSVGINFKQKVRTKKILEVNPEEPKEKKKDKSTNFPDFIEQID